VLRSSPGHVGFPVRLAREMFEQCRAFQPPESRIRSCDLYDPCCGAGQLITTLGLLYGDHIATLAASDASAAAVELTANNLALLTASGLDARIAHLLSLHEQHHKDSHAAAVESARALRDRTNPGAATTRCFLADAGNAASLRSHLGPLRPNIVITDFPYGWQSSWVDSGNGLSPSASIRVVLDALLQVTTDDCVLALATDRSQRVDHPGCERLRQFRIGRRRITWLRRSSRKSTSSSCRP
jgi:hypothetical protein